MDSMRKLWLGLALVFCRSFAALGWLGREIYLAAPPIPERIRTPGGETLYTGEQVLNLGLAMMVFMSLVPAGIYQAYHSIHTGLWYARSPEIARSGVMEALVWLRVPGDVVCAVGAALLAVYALRLLRRPGQPQLELRSAAAK